MVLIGIGGAGTNLVNSFAKHHKKITITKDDFPSSCQKTEDYETHCPDFSDRLSFDEDECWVALCGAGKVSGCALRVMETIKHKKINIIYIYPDVTLCNTKQVLRNKVCYNVLQEFTRSGLLNRMYLFSNKEVVAMIGDQPLNRLYKGINKQIANAIETVQWLNNQEPVMGSNHESKEISRICTLSVGNFKKNEENLFFLLDNITEACYLYSVSKNQLDKNKDLLRLIKERIQKDENEKIISSFVIYPSEHSQSFFYSLKLTHYIQEKK